MGTLEMIQKTANSGNNNNSGDFYIIKNIKTENQMILWANNSSQIIADVIDGKKNDLVCEKPLEQNELFFEKLVMDKKTVYIS